MLSFWDVLTKKMPLIFCFAKSFSPAIRTFCDARIVKMDRNIYLIPFRLEFSFTFWTNVCFWYYNDVQDDKQDKYRNSYKIPWYIEMTTEPIHLTGWEHKSWDKQKQRNKYFLHIITAFLVLLYHSLRYFSRHEEEVLNEAFADGEYEAEALRLLWSGGVTAVKRSAH